MTREEAIQVLKDWDGYFIGHSSDDVNEALNMAIEELKKEPKEITFDDVQRYCKPRCLTIITNELLYQFMQDTTNMGRQNAICKSHRIVGDKYECCFAEKGQPVVHCGGDKNKCEILDEEE